MTHATPNIAAAFDPAAWCRALRRHGWRCAVVPGDDGIWFMRVAVYVDRHGVRRTRMLSKRHGVTLKGELSLWHRYRAGTNAAKLADYLKRQLAADAGVRGVAESVS